MKKLLFFGVPLFLATIIFAAVTFFLNQNSGKGALQVTANPKSNVYLNGKLIGQTPLCKCDLPDMLKTGDYAIRLQPQDIGFLPFEEKITIAQSVLTVIDRMFGKDATSEGSIITLIPMSDKKATQLLAISFPDNASVYVDSVLSGTTPILKKDLTVSDHEVKFSKQGYREKAIRIRTVLGYKLSVTAYLGLEEGQATKNAQPNPTVEATPTIAVSTVLILQTPTGFLRVRAKNSVSSSEIARVTPGETFELVSENSGWFEIKLSDGRTGWISSQYAQKQ